MNKTSLPVLLIRNMTIFPWSEVRLEFERDSDKKTLSLAESFYENNVVIVNPNDLLEIDPEIEELPKMGVLCQIKMKIDMPNGKTRAILAGINRVNIYTYSKEDNIYEAMVSNTLDDDLDSKEELAYSRALIKHVEIYVREVPYVSNIVLDKIIGINSINRLTDIIALYLPLTFERKVEYINEPSSTTRVKMILDDINRDIEVMKLEKQIELEVNKQLEDTQKEFVLRERIKAIKEELGEGEDKDSEIENLKERINNLKCPKKVTERLNYELKRYESSNMNSPEVGIIKTYIDWLLDLPWNNFTKDIKDLNKVRESLDKSHYGLDKVKDRIIEYLAAKQNSDKLKSPIICLVGPPGVGKTSLAKSIAFSMNRKFAKISVGGINDEAEIVGHRRTYIGSAPGLIIQGMKKAGTTNPVFIIDEIDKMTKDIKGDPASSLLEVLDHEQNSSFSDHYIEEEFDLSHVMFITTANYIEQIPYELKDRLEIIELYSYTEYEKLDIAKRHIIPNKLYEYNVDDKKIQFTDEAILEIIRSYTKEAGVRNLERMIESIIRKIVKLIVVDKIKDNFLIDNKKVIDYLGNRKFIDTSYKENLPVGVVNGLAYTEFGGDILQIEVNKYKGSGAVILTGSLGEVMKESASIAISYIKSNSDKLKVDENIFKENDIHIHIPEGAVPKEGPSAGVTLTTAILSCILEKKVKKDIAMTGEITLTGHIIAIGGLREKITAASRNKIKKVFIPKENEKDLDEIPDSVKGKMKFILTGEYLDIFKEIF